MADIQLSPADDNPVTLQFRFNTPQQFFYIVEVTDDAGNQYFHDAGKWNGKTSFDLGAASALAGRYLNIFWTVIDPLGAGNAYNATAIAQHNGAGLEAAQECSGTSTEAQAIQTTTGKIV